MAQNIAIGAADKNTCAVGGGHESAVYGSEPRDDVVTYLYRLQEALSAHEKRSDSTSVGSHEYSVAYRRYGRGGIGAMAYEGIKMALRGIKAVEATRRRHPKIACRGEMHSRQRVGVRHYVGVEKEAAELTAVDIENEHSGIGGDIQGISLAGKGVDRHINFVGEYRHHILHRRRDYEKPGRVAHENLVARPFGNGLHTLGVKILARDGKTSDIVAVETVEAETCAEPYVTAGILEDAVYNQIAQPAVAVEMTKFTSAAQSVDSRNSKKQYQDKNTDESQSLHNQHNRGSRQKTRADEFHGCNAKVIQICVFFKFLPII